MKLLRHVLCTAIVASTMVLAAPSVSQAATTRVYTGAVGAPTIGIIGDSSVAAIRWSNSWDSLSSINYAFNAESCRRTTGTSCSGREGYAPPNALDTMRAEPGRWGSVLVMVTGYNDAGTSFASSVDAIMAEAARQGISKVMWLTMRTADVSYVAPTFQSNTYTFRDNNRILLQKAEQYGGRLQIADWATYTADKASWFASDGVHYQAAGARGAGAYIAAQAKLVAAGADITPPRASDITNSGWVTLRIGDRGSGVASVQRALMAKGVTVFGGADGIFGRYTEAAVKTFQRRVDLLESGAVGLATAQQLGLYGSAPPATGNTSTTTATTAPPAAVVSWSTINVDERSSRAALAQQAIMRAGIYLRGGADGHFGPVSSQALRLYQQRYGLPSTGVVDRATAIHMGLVAPSATAPPPAPTAWRTIGVGVRNSSAVRTAQQTIINAGIFLRGGADGWFGQYTATALRTYQSRMSLPVTGVIDEATAIRMGLYTKPTITSTTSTTTTSTTSTTTTSTTTTTTTTTVAPSTLTVGGRVWDDGAAGDSLYDELVDTAVEGVEVRLIDDTDAVVATTLTLDDGTFEFTVDAAGTYRVEFVAPLDTGFVAADAGDDDTVDSDVVTIDPVTAAGSSAAAAVALGDVVVVDAGLMPAPAAPVGP